MEIGCINLKYDTFHFYSFSIHFYTKQCTNKEKYKQFIIQKQTVLAAPQCKCKLEEFLPPQENRSLQVKIKNGLKMQNMGLMGRTANANVNQ